MVLTVLSVAEKPSVAKELAAIIGRCHPDSIKRPGRSPYNPIFEIKNCSFRNQPASMTMTSVAGHLMETDFLPEFRQWNSCSPLDLFDAAIRKEVKAEGENIRRTLDEQARRHNVLLLWLDCDMEGEAIAYEVIEVCLKANPHMDVFRARFSALIERDIIRAVQNPDRPNKNLNDAVEARQEIDLRIGSAFTRFQTIRLQKRFDSLGKSVISYGPCQFPTLGFVVQRHDDIQKFIAQTFWYLTCEAQFEHPDDPSKSLSLSFSWDRGRLYDRFACFL
eukprot:gene20628-24673_t